MASTVLLAAIVSLLTPAAPAAHAVPAAFEVTKTADTADGVCDADCSLREAIIAANSNGNPVDSDVVNVPAGTYRLTIEGSDEEAGATGDLDVLENLAIVGGGSDMTVIEQRSEDRVLHGSGGVDLDLRGVTLTGGDVVGDGGGVLQVGGSLAIEEAGFTSNRATWTGGGISCPNCTAFTIEGANVIGNRAPTGAGVISESSAPSTVVFHDLVAMGNEGTDGAGVLVYRADPASTTTITDTTVSENLGSGDLTGLTVYGGTVTVQRTLAEANVGAVQAGLALFGDGPMLVEDVSVDGNEAAASLPGMLFGSSGPIDLTVRRATANDLSDSMFASGVLITDHDGGPDASIEFEDVEVRDPGAAQFSSGIHWATSPTSGTVATSFTDVRVSGAVANGSGLFSGGAGISIRGPGTFTADGLDVSGNHDVTSVQVGLTLQDVDATIDGSRFTGNTGGGSDSPFLRGGGGIGLVRSTLTGTGLIIRGNDLVGQGGGIRLEESVTELFTSSILDNTVSDGGSANGGGVFVDGSSTLRLTNSTVAGNRAEDDGGGIYAVDGGAVASANTTIAVNTASATSGGGIYDAGDGAPTILTHTILAGNSPDNCAGAGAVTSGDHNLEDADDCGLQGDADRSTTDPVLLGVGLYGAGTPSYALSPVSPAVDGGAAGCTEADGTTPNAVAQNAVIRPLDGDGDGTTQCDIGAFEFSAVVGIARVTVGDEDGPEPATATVVRAGDTTGAITVHYVTTDITTMSGSDYVPPAGSIEIPAGATSADILIDVLDDATAEGQESLELALTDGAYVIAPGAADAIIDISDDDAAPIVRHHGATRIETAVEVSRRVFPDGAPTAIVAVATDYPDALAAGPYARLVGGPILLTAGDRLSGATRAELLRLGVDRVTIVGGLAAIAPEVEAELRAAGILTITRVAGDDRFATAARLADLVLDRTMGSAPSRVYITQGIHNPGEDADARGWPDALAAAAVAAFDEVPILLVRTDAIPRATLEALRRVRPAEAVVVGGPVAVSDPTVAAIDDEVGTTVRVAGVDRYETASEVAQRGVAMGMDAGEVWFATGSRFPDALVAGPAVALTGSTLLLVDGADATRFGASAARRWLDEHALRMTLVHLLGGPSAINGDVQARIAAAVAR